MPSATIRSGRLDSPRSSISWKKYPSSYSRWTQTTTLTSSPPKRKSTTSSTSGPATATPGTSSLRPFSTKTDPVGRIRAALDQCPDESPAPGTEELRFITDADLRTNLRNDIGAINLALSNGEWKAATVLAGSAIEALLLWALQQRPQAEITIATTTLQTARTLTSTVPADLEDWVLHQYTEVAVQLGAIGPATATEVRLAKGFRNLIHPGRAQRLGQTCDRGTALSCVAALEHVVRDLS
jgi:hypothetical protein